MKKLFSLICLIVILCTFSLISGCEDVFSQSKQDASALNKSIEDVTKEYLSQEIFSFTKNAKCAYKVIDKVQNEDQITQYLMVLAKSGPTEALVPVCITIKKENDAYTVIEFKNPLTLDDEREADKLFPQEILDKLNSGEYSNDKVVEELENELDHN
jgi:hypothetical protein